MSSESLALAGAKCGGDLESGSSLIENLTGCDDDDDDDDDGGAGGDNSTATVVVAAVAGVVFVVLLAACVDFLIALAL